MRTAAKKLYNDGLLMSPHPKILTAEDLVAGYEGQTKIKTKKTLEGTRGHLAILQKAEKMLSPTGPHNNYFGGQSVEQIFAELQMDREARRLCLVFQGAPERLLAGLKSSDLAQFFTSLTYTPRQASRSVDPEALFPPSRFRVDPDAAALFQQRFNEVDPAFEGDFVASVQRHARKARAPDGPRVPLPVTRGVVQAALDEQLSKQGYLELSAAAEDVRPRGAPPVQPANLSSRTTAPIYDETVRHTPNAAVEARETARAHALGPAELSEKRLSQVAAPTERARLEGLMMKLNEGTTAGNAVDLLRAISGSRPVAEVRELLKAVGLSEADYKVLAGSRATRRGAGQLADALQGDIDAAVLLKQLPLRWVCSRCGNQNPDCPYRVMLEAGDYEGAGGRWSEADAGID
jgi:hypothetical protein